MKKILTSLLLAAVVAFPGVTTAANSALGDAFQDLVGGSMTVNTPGFFQSQVRNTVTLGSGSMRFQSVSNATPLGINFTPPSLEVGCNGIDWHFGGLSWINGAEIKHMLKAAGPAALLYVIKLAINALCEDCANELGNIVALLQKLAQGSMNSCQLGASLAQAALDVTNDAVGFCKAGSATSGVVSSFSAARALCQGNAIGKLLDQGWIKSMQQQVSDFVSSIPGDPIQAFFGGAPTPSSNQEAQANARQIGISGNMAWNALIRAGVVLDEPDLRNLGASSSATLPEATLTYKMGLAVGELMMSMMHFMVKPGPDTGDSKTEQGHSVDPTISGPRASDVVLGLLMCGSGYFEGNIEDVNGVPLPAGSSGGGSLADLTSPAKIAKGICDDVFATEGTPVGTVITNSDITIRVCDPVSANYNSATYDAESFMHYSMNQCYNEDDAESPVAKIPIEEWVQRDYVKATIANGTLMMSLGMMSSIIQKIIQSDPRLGVGSSTGLKPKEIAFVSAAPFPLYKILNMAALFPGARAGIYESYGKLMGLMMARDFMINLYRTAGQYSSSYSLGKTTDASIEVRETLKQQVAALMEDVYMSINQINKNMRRGMVITKQIRIMEQNLRNTIFNRQLLGNQAFVFDVSSANASTP